MTPRERIEQEWNAVCSFLTRASVPLVKEKGQRACIVGMGTFFEFNGCRYLITAAHVLKQHGLESVGVPENASRGSIRTFGRCTIRRPRLDDYDVAVVKLEDPELLSFVSPYWRFLGLSNVGSNHFGRPHYLVAGYPEEFIQYCGSDLGPSGLLIVDTEPYTGKPENENGSGDFYLKYGEQARNLAKTIVASPTLPGLSGTSVWKAFGREERFHLDRRSEHSCSWSSMCVPSARLHSRRVVVDRAEAHQRFRYSCRRRNQPCSSRHLIGDALCTGGVT